MISSTGLGWIIVIFSDDFYYNSPISFDALLDLFPSNIFGFIGILEEDLEVLSLVSSFFFSSKTFLSVGMPKSTNEKSFKLAVSCFCYCAGTGIEKSLKSNDCLGGSAFCS